MQSQIAYSIYLLQMLPELKAKDGASMSMTGFSKICITRYMIKRKYHMARKFQLDSAQNVQTKEVIARTLEIADKYAGELAIEVLPLDSIELDPENNRELTLTLHDAIHGIS